MIAVAFTWVFFLDPFSGVVNALTVHYGVADAPVNFLGDTVPVPISFLGLTIQFPLALATVIAFEAWRYFPLSFLFILARLQALPQDLYEAAEVDGATPLAEVPVHHPAAVDRHPADPLHAAVHLDLQQSSTTSFLLTGGAAGTPHAHRQRLRAGLRAPESGRRPPRSR